MTDPLPVYRQISPTIIVDPDGRSIPINFDNKDYREFTEWYDAGLVQLDLAFDPTEPHP